MLDTPDDSRDPEKVYTYKILDKPNTSRDVDAKGQSIEFLDSQPGNMKYPNSERNKLGAYSLFLPKNSSKESK